MLELYGYTPQCTVADVTVGKDFFIQITDMYLIKKDKKQAYLLLFPDTEIFFEILKEHQDNFISAYKNDNGEIIFHAQETHQKVPFLLKGKDFLRHFYIKNGIILYSVNYIDITADEAASANTYLEIESAVSVITKTLPFSSYSLSELNSLLDEAVTNEDYERASKIRDEIAKR